MTTTRTLAQIATFLGGSVIAGDASMPVENLAGLEDAGAKELSFYDNVKYRKAALATQAGALLVKEKLEGFKGAQLQTPMPYLAFMQLVPEFYPERKYPAGAHATSVVAPSAKVAASASVGPRVVVDERAIIGERVVLMAGAYVGQDAVIGDDCVIYPNVVVWERCTVGRRCLLHSGTVIGDDGFGYRRDENGHQKIRHVGHVEIGDDVEIGANCAIDRGTFGRTVIGNGTKIDNLVHLAHNVRIGERTLIIAQ
ncbi:MAG TPA: UDP-3-O-(3-hydroxymyristoyl)glucosamine N-acyltransferase, partial [bacterium]|nr:UDP-3-O-(3-hydroxymyristoyl)glucosamine N-acyltransferase [bacterium]